MSQYYIDIALNEAKKAYNSGEVPVGAVIVKEGVIIARARNKRHSDKDVLAHAEIMAIKKAQKKLKDWRLYNCDMYVTLKPCSMCENIIKESRLMNVYYFADKSVQKNAYQQTKIVKLTSFSTEKMETYTELLTSFFDSKR